MTLEDWKDLLLVMIGAGIGFLLSILTIIMNRILDNAGKVLIFYKIVNEPSVNYPSGISIRGEEIKILIPIYFDFQNTKNTSVVLRDVCLYLYYKGNCVDKMVQIEDIKQTHNNTDQIDIHKKGGEKSEYSFVVPPSTLTRQICCFFDMTSTTLAESKPIDEIRLAYYDEANKRMEAKIMDLPNGWQATKMNNKEDYTLLKCRKVKRR